MSEKNQSNPSARSPRSEPSTSARLWTRDVRVWVLRSAMFLILLGSGILWTYAGIWMKRQGMGETFIGVLVGAGSAISAVTGLLWGWLADRTRKGTVAVAAGCLLAGSGLILLAHSRTPLGFCVYQLLASLGMAATLSLMPVLALALIGEERPGAGYANFRIFGSLGYISGLFVLAALIPTLQRTLITAGVLFAAAAVPLACLDVPAPARSQVHGFRALVRHPELLGMLVALFFHALGLPAAFTFLPLYARKLGMSQPEIGRLMGMCGLVAVPGLPLMGWLADRYGMRGVLTASFAALPVRILLQAAAGGPAGLYVAQLLHILTWAGREVTMYTYVTRLAGRRDRAVAVSGLLTALTLGQLAGNPLCGWLAEHTSYRGMFLVMAGLSSVGLVVFLLCSNGGRRRRDG